MAELDFVSIPGSERKPVRGARATGPIPPNERLRVTVRVRRRKPLPAAAIDGRQSPSMRTYLTRAELEADHGADPKDIQKVEEFARQYQLIVIESSAARRSVILSGTVPAFGRAFRVNLQTWEHPGGTYRGREGPVQVPSALANIIVGVFGLDNRPFAKPHFKRQPHDDGETPAPSYTPPQVAQFYDFPVGVDGTGQVIGIIELGGGYQLGDLQAYAQLIGVPVANVTAVLVNNAVNSPTTADSADGEVMLDIEVVSSIAPGAKIVVYFAPSTQDSDFLEAITQAVHDSVNDPSVISISWGGPESSTNASFETEFDQVLQSAAALGITVTVASGDDGAGDENPQHWDNLPHADVPASSPFALACGATNIQVANGGIVSESVWNWNVDPSNTQADSFDASGGGISENFPLPSYQAAAGVPVNPSTGNAGRGVPDVSGDGDPASGYRIQVDGQQLVMGGTSAVAPLWAALIALVNQKLNKRVGFINPLLYANPGALRDITQGNNQVGANKVGFTAGPGWDACTGLGSPDGLKVLAVLGAPPPPASPTGGAG
ncbi:MAG TPA: S53 family peptidase [Dongiaceae bacterium]|nr:S53 family peptidase [Dongiaceae bacterium]